jgi:hypothetical protein
MYEKGLGVARDYVKAYMWYELAAMRGHKAAGQNREIVASRMTPAQISRARELAREWIEERGTTNRTRRMDVSGDAH